MSRARADGTARRRNQRTKTSVSFGVMLAAVAAAWGTLSLAALASSRADEIGLPFSLLNRFFLAAGDQPATGGEEKAGEDKSDKEENAEEKKTIETEDWNAHVQSTTVFYGYPPIHSPYVGPQSLPGDGQYKYTESITGFFGMRLPVPGAELYYNPEYNSGYGIGETSTTGLAGFPDGDAQKAGAHFPGRPNIAARLFLRETIGFGGGQEAVESDQNQLAGYRDISRLTVTIGKFAIPDLFDDNSYSHDPRTQFQNWALMDAGAWDYGADQKGYTHGIALELNQKDWAVRGGYFSVPRVSNVNDLSENFTGKYGSFNFEAEDRYTIADQPGVFRVLPWFNRANMGSYRLAVANAATDPLGINDALDASRKDRTKYGLVLNMEQALSDDLGAFARYSWNDGKEEIMSFTDITTSYSAGLSLKGARWGRPDDVVGLAGIVDTISHQEIGFLKAGGTGILIGDGQLSHYAPEGIIETYYSLQLTKPLALTFDYQFFANPAYNQDRGPVHVFLLRAHLQF